MVVLAASICTKSGKPVISRQFREMPRSRIEGLLTSFPKLIPTNSQHTSVETSDVRYVYQPLDDLYILLITNKASNILQDIDTLHLFARVVSDMCRSADEKEIHRNAFELLGAFDEIVSLGYREQVNLMQIRSVLEMESHEEKIQEIIARNKEAEAKEELKRRAKQLEMQRRDQTRRTGGGGSSNIGGGLSAYSSVPRFEVSSEPVRTASPANVVSTRAPAFKGSGMKLGSKKGKQSDLMDALGTEIATPNTSVNNTPARASSPERPRFTSNVTQESVHVAISEQLSLTLNQAGGLKSIALKGDLHLLITDPTHNKIRLALPELAEDYGSDLQFKYHPNLFKGPDAEKGGLESEIRLKDDKRAWPVGQPLGVLRWKLAGKDESFVPLSINCWPTPTGDGTTEVNIEYDLESDKLTLHDLTISIPLPGSFPAVGSHIGSYNVDPTSNALVWTIPIVSPSQNKSGSLEFTIDGEDTTVFFPVKVDFTAEGSLVGVNVEKVSKADGTGDVVFSQEATCSTEEYTVV